MNRHFRSQVRLSCDGKLTRNRANSNFHRQSAIVILSPICTLHLHYFIHRVRQNCQTNHFPFQRERFLVSFSKFWIWKTVDLMMSHDFCQRISWKIAKANVWAKFHIPTLLYAIAQSLLSARQHSSIIVLFSLSLFSFVLYFLEEKDMKKFEGND